MIRCRAQSVKCTNQQTAYAQTVPFIPSYPHFPMLALPLFTCVSPFLCPYLLPVKNPTPNYFLPICSSFSTSVPKLANSDKVTYIISDIDVISDTVTYIISDIDGISNSYRSAVGFQNALLQLSLVFGQLSLNNL